MKPRSRMLTVGAATGALLSIQLGGAYVLDELRLADRLFAADGAGVLVALLVLAVVASRALLAFVVPGYITASLVLWLLRRIRSAGRHAPEGL